MPQADITPSHSITSSARARSDDGTSRPSAFAVLKLMTSSERPDGLGRLVADLAYEREAFRPNLTRAEADERIATLAARLKLLGEPPHTL